MTMASSFHLSSNFHPSYRITTHSPASSSRQRVFGQPICRLAPMLIMLFTRHVLQLSSALSLGGMTTTPSATTTEGACWDDKPGNGKCEGRRWMKRTRRSGTSPGTYNQLKATFLPSSCFYTGPHSSSHLTQPSLSPLDISQ